MVYSRLALHHLPDAWKAVALSRVRGMIRPGGLMRLVDVVYRFEPQDAFERLDACCARVGDEVVGAWARAELEEHARDEHVVGSAIGSVAEHHSPGAPSRLKRSRQFRTQRGPCSKTVTTNVAITVASAADSTDYGSVGSRETGGSSRFATEVVPSWASARSSGRLGARYDKCSHLAVLARARRC